MSAPEVSEDVARRVVGSLGFPKDRVERAVACLLAKEHLPARSIPVERVLSFKETCEALALSKSSLRRIINTGEINPIRLSKRRIGFRVQDVNAFIGSRM